MELVRSILWTMAKMMRRCLYAALIVALVVPSVRLTAQPSPDVNRLMELVIDSLALADEARATILKAESSSDIERMTNTRVGITKLNQAARLVASFPKSPDEMTSNVSTALSSVYETLALLMTRSLDTFETIVRLEAQAKDGGTVNQAQLAELGITISKVNADIDTAWKAIAQVAALSTNALVNYKKPDAAGQNRYLRITSKERAELRAQLERSFDKRVLQAIGGGHAVQVAPRLIWEFLGQPGWKPSDAP